MNPESATAAVTDIGHNQPPTDAEILRLKLEEDNIALLARRDELLESCERMPEEIDSEEMAGKFTSQMRMLQACIKDGDERRKTDKAPHLEAGRTVDGFFNGVIDPLKGVKASIQARQNTWARKKADDERRRRDEEARKAREEAEAAAASAETEEDLDEAVAAEDLANSTAREAAAPVAELSRTRDDYGGVSSISTRWVHHVEDRGAIDLNLLRGYFRDEEIDKAIRGFVKAGGRELKGVRIFEDQQVTTR